MKRRKNILDFPPHRASRGHRTGQTEEDDGVGRRTAPRAKKKAPALCWSLWGQRAVIGGGLTDFLHDADREILVSLGINLRRVRSGMSQTDLGLLQAVAFPDLCRSGVSEPVGAPMG